MAKEDVDNYFRVVCNDYHNVIEVLHEVEEFVQKNIMSPERLDEIKAEVEKTKNNYTTISYIMYLLNKPKNKKKLEWYNNTNKLDISHDLNAVIEEDKESIEKIRNYING